MIKLTVNVTKKCIESGIPSCNNGCPIALAVRDAFPAALVAVTYMLPMGNEMLMPQQHTTLPDEAMNFILSFDKCEQVEPISFDIEVPDAVVNEINIDEIRPLLINHPTLSLAG